MDWGQIVIVVFVTILVCFAIYVSKRSERLIGVPYKVDPAMIELQKAREICRRPWAEDPIAKSIKWDERVKGGGGVGHKLRYVGSRRVEFQPVHPKFWYIILSSWLWAALLLYILDSDL